MSRVKSVRELQAQLAAAQKREAALAKRKPGQNVGNGTKRRNQSVRYQSVSTGKYFTALAPSPGVTFFGGLAALGLADPQGDDGLPRGYKTARIIAQIGLENGVRQTSKLSGRPYLRYTPDGNTNRKSYSAPISGSTMTELRTKFENAAKAKKDDVKEYGRIYFKPERPIFVISGDTPDGGTTP